ncbi:MAG: Na+/H+ antiporter NhaA [Proteobacteria bacterium]|nr:Na+/H+ antiporter NhaA [Pseudomonadota bacterium]
MVPQFRVPCTLLVGVEAASHAAQQVRAGRAASSWSRTPVTQRPDSPFASLIAFLRVEAGSGIVLLAAAAVALIWANSPAAHLYQALWEPLRLWVNDGLMTLFFLLVGLELRRELREGALADFKRATLPAVAALGGVLFPALIYITFNANTPHSNGWAIPTATDIAFAVGILALLGKRVPPALRVLLLAIAIVDDVVAILVIAIFYSDAGSGVHPALAGVVIGFLIPVSPARRLEHHLHPWVAFGIVPLFALANAGVNLAEVNLNFAATLVGGVIVGLVVGKPVGILLATALAVRLNWCALPTGVGYRQVAVIGCLGGIGFTMSIFISQLAFAGQAELVTAKAAILMGSGIAAVVGLTAGRYLLPPS